MIKVLKIFIILSFISVVSFAQNSISSTKEFQLKAPNDPIPFAETISSEDMRAILTVLAGDEMEGRETGTSGNANAAKFIANKLESFGIPKVEKLGSYFQPIAFSSEKWEDISLKVGDSRYRHLWEFYSFTNLNSDRAAQNINEVVFFRLRH